MLSISLKKKADGSTVLSCRRDEGSETWQHHRGPQARFFPLHDLTHYAVESVLVEHVGFYGLVAEGWNLSDFEKPWSRGPLPGGAGVVEVLVGLLTAEAAEGEVWEIDSFNRELALFWEKHGLEACEISEVDLTKARGLRDELFGRWRLVPVGEALTLEFRR